MNIQTPMAWGGVSQHSIKITMSFVAAVQKPTARLGYSIRPAPSDTKRTILLAVAIRHGLTIEELTGPGQFREVAWPRQEAMWLMYKTGRYSLPQIGRYLGGRDHTTVLYGIRRHQARLDEAARERDAA
jgi:chromosomal replication initiation ATPase DnaA